MSLRRGHVWLGALAVAGALSVLVWTAGLAIPAPLFGERQPFAHHVPLVEFFGFTAAGANRLMVIMALLWAPYVVAVVAASRLTSSRPAMGVAVLVTLCLTAVAAATYPVGSRDIWHYVADSRAFVFRSSNPMTESAFLYSGSDPVLFRFSVWNPTTQLPEGSAYGPVWYLVSAVPAVLAGDSVVGNLLAMKLLGAVFFLGGLPLVFRLAERVKPGTGLPATVMYGWSPLLLWSSVVDAHNDIVMAFFVLLSLHEAMARRWEVAVPLLFVGALVKYLSVLFVPVYLLYALKTDGRRVVPGLAFGLAAGLVLVAVFWLPFWEGPHTFDLLRSISNRALHSPVAAIVLLIDPGRANPGGVFGVPGWIGLLSAGAFLACTLAVLLWAWKRDPMTFGDCCAACFTILLAYLALRSWWFFPWYLAPLLPVGMVLASSRLAIVAILYSLGALSITVPFGWREIFFGASLESLATYNIVTSLLALGPPLAFMSGVCLVSLLASSGLRTGRAEKIV